jgi:hypothetical protein
VCMHNNNTIDNSIQRHTVKAQSFAHPTTTIHLVVRFQEPSLQCRQWH